MEKHIEERSVLSVSLHSRNYSSESLIVMQQLKMRKKHSERESGKQIVTEQQPLETKKCHRKQWDRRKELAGTNRGRIAGKHYKQRTHNDR